MLSLINLSHYRLLTKCVFRSYSLCCPPRKPTDQCGCPPTVPGAGTEIKPPPECCCPCKIPPNPCCPLYHHGENTWKKYKYFALLVCFPLILFQSFNVSGHAPPCKGECRDYEYMRIRSKKFPWRDGVKSLFHNDRVNHLPGECVPPPLDCD